MDGADILALDDRPIDKIKVPEWNDAIIYIRTMGATERAKHETTLIDSKDAPLDEKMVRVKVGLVVLCACDKDGNRLFTDDQYDAVKVKNADAIDRIYDAINRTNLVAQSEVDEEKKD